MAGFKANHGVQNPISQVGGACDGRWSKAGVFGRVGAARVALIIHAFWFVCGTERILLFLFTRACWWGAGVRLLYSGL